MKHSQMGDQRMLRREEKKENSVEQDQKSLLVGKKNLTFSQALD